ncbi:hypothetical protein ABEW05_011628 [Botrytis cinerea]
MTRFKRQASSVEHPASSIQHPASSVQRPALKTIAAILPDWTIFHGAIFKAGLRATLPPPPPLPLPLPSPLPLLLLSSSSSSSSFNAARFSSKLA